MLTDENYYQDKTYLSNSRMKQYLACEARAKAIDDGRWREDRDQKPLLFGNYVHSYFESEEAHTAFKEQNKKALFSSCKPYGLLKDFELAEKVIETLATDDSFNKLYHGFSGDDVRKEMIVTGTVEGVPVKGKIDSINLSRGYFVDLKTMKSIYAKDWNAELRQKVPTAANNILVFGYHGQLALYRELLKQMTGIEYRPIIVAVSKEKQPDKEVISIDEVWLEEGLQHIKDNIKRIWQVINNEDEPKKCGHCDYCRSQKKLGRVVTLNELLEMQ